MGIWGGSTHQGSFNPSTLVWNCHRWGGDIFCCVFWRWKNTWSLVQKTPTLPAQKVNGKEGFLLKLFPVNLWPTNASPYTTNNSKITKFVFPNSNCFFKNQKLFKKRNCMFLLLGGFSCLVVFCPSFFFALHWHDFLRPNAHHAARLEAVGFQGLWLFISGNHICNVPVGFRSSRVFCVYFFRIS